MSDSSEVSPLLKLAVALFEEKIITLMQLKEDDTLFCISMPFELNITQEGNALLVAIELLPSDADEYADRMNHFLAQSDEMLRWDIGESHNHTVMAFLSISFDVDLAVAEIEGGLVELRDFFAEYFEQEMDPLDHGERTLNFMWLHR